MWDKVFFDRSFLKVCLLLQSVPPPCHPCQVFSLMVCPLLPHGFEERSCLFLVVWEWCLLSSHSFIWYIISIGVSCWKELPDWTPSLWSALTKSHHELPVLLVNKLTYPESTELHFHLCFSMFAGHTIVLYNWAGQLDALYTQAVFVVFFPSKTSNLLICLHSLGYISSQIMHTTLFLTLHFPLILKSNLSSECPGRQQRRKENISKGKRVTWTI